MGDLVGKKCGVSANPGKYYFLDITTHSLKHNQMLILASDGIWDMIQTHQVTLLFQILEVVRENLKN